MRQLFLAFCLVHADDPGRAAYSEPVAALARELDGEQEGFRRAWEAAKSDKEQEELRGQLKKKVRTLARRR